MVEEKNAAKELFDKASQLYSTSKPETDFSPTWKIYFMENEIV